VPPRNGHALGSKDPKFDDKSRADLEDERPVEIVNFIDDWRAVLASVAVTANSNLVSPWRRFVHRSRCLS
jgi:hypothetical protein